MSNNVAMSVRLSTGHTIHVVFPSDDQFVSRDQLRLAMLEASIEFRKLADKCQSQALKAEAPGS